MSGEYALICSIHQMLAVLGLRHHHSPNETPSASRAAMNRAAGTSPGMPDFLVFGPHFPVDRPALLALEVKSGKGRLTREQREWLEYLEASGWHVNVVRSMDEAIEAVKAAYPSLFVEV